MNCCGNWAIRAIRASVIGTPKHLKFQLWKRNPYRFIEEAFEVTEVSFEVTEVSFEMVKSYSKPDETLTFWLNFSH